MSAASAHTHDVTTHRTFCRWCPALCGLLVDVADGRVTAVRGDPQHPLSRGYTCPKGRSLAAWHDHPRRLDRVRTRSGAAGSVGTDAGSVGHVLDEMADRIAALADAHGPDAIGTYLGTAAFFDAGRGPADRFLAELGSASRYTTLTVDCPSKPLVSELVSGYRLFPVVDESSPSVLVLVGTNPVVSHGQALAWPDPVRRLRRASAEGRLWVVDPRRSEAAQLANGHVAVRPGSDDALLAWLVRCLLEQGADNEYLDRHADGVDELRQAVAEFDDAKLAEVCGVAPAEVQPLLDTVRECGRVSVVTGTGISMGRRANTTEWLAWALMIITGSLDRRGGGMWLNPGYFAQLDRATTPPSDGSPAPGPSSRPDLPRRNDQIPCVALADEIETGALTALFVVGGNPLTAVPDPDRLRAALAQLDTLVVLDVIDNEVTELATHVLPCVGQLERADIPLWTNLMCTAVVGDYTEAVISPRGDSRPVWWWFGQLARRLGIDVLPPGVDVDSAVDDDLLRPIVDNGRSSFELLRSAGGAHVAETEVVGWVHERLPGGRWRIAPRELVAQLAEPYRIDPLVLIPRRQLRHLNSSMRDLPAGGRLDPPEVQVHPSDAAARHIVDGAPVTVASASGRVTATARVTGDIRAGAVSLPHGFADPNVVALVSPTDGVDPHTGMPVQSGVPVELTPGET